jgi:hypothetical protein
MIRGADAEVTRDLDMEKDLGIPKDRIDKAVQEAARREAKNPERSRGGEAPAPFKLAGQGGIVAIYAAQPTEVTLEREMPPRTDGAQVYGLLSYTMCQVLTESLEQSKEPITYNELARRIHGQYVAWGRTFPTPLIEGDDRDREILGDKVWPGRSSLILSARDGLKVNAGALHGLTPDSILSVVSPPGQGNKALGFVRVGEVRTFDADVTACDEAGKAARTEFPDGAVCKVHFSAVGDQRLKVAVDPADAAGKAVPEGLRQKLVEAVKRLDGAGSVVQSVEAPKAADWLVRAWGGGQQVVLVPAAGWSVGHDASAVPSFGPAAVDDKLTDWLKESLQRVARAEALKRLAAGGEATADGGVKIKVTPLRCKDRADKRGSIPFAWPGPSLAVYDGDRMVVRISNTGRAPVDVTILYIDSGCGINCLYPKDGEVNRLAAGDTITTAPLRVTGKTAGLEQMVVLAVKGQGQPVDFSALEQPSLDRAVASRGQAREALETPLGRLLKKGLYGQGDARGLTRDEVEDNVMVLMPLHVRPEKRPEDPK